MDLCSRRIVGWKLDSSLAAPLVVDAFQRALKGWAVAPRVHHSGVSSILRTGVN
jgi:transposase InsO family protein